METPLSDPRVLPDRSLPVASSALRSADLRISAEAKRIWICQSMSVLLVATLTPAVTASRTGRGFDLARSLSQRWRIATLTVWPVDAR